MYGRKIELLNSSASTLGNNSVFGAIMLILLIVIIAVAAYFTTKMVGVKTMRRAKGYFGKKTMYIVDSLSLGKDKSIVLVQIGGKVYLLGVSPGSINLLCDDDRMDFSVSETAGQASGPGPIEPAQKEFEEQESGFAAKLTDSMKGIFKGAPPEEKRPDSSLERDSIEGGDDFLKRMERDMMERRKRMDSLKDGGRGGKP